MTPSDMIDQTGQPRATEDLGEALQAVRKEIVLCRLTSMPEFFVFLPTISDALKELISRRAAEQEVKAPALEPSDPGASEVKDAGSYNFRERQGGHTSTVCRGY